MLFRKRNGFTLIELLVVISIIAVLAAALTTQVTKARSMGQSIRCKANLRALAQASLSFAVDNERLPYAGSYEYMWAATDGGRYKVKFFERKGWVSWTGGGPWSSDAPARGKQSCFFGDNSFQSITNGVLWSYVGKNLATYTCDVHKRVALRAGLLKVNRSYVMNGYFGFNHIGNYTKENMPAYREIRLDALTAVNKSAGNMLLFAELPAYKGTAHVESINSATSDSVSGPSDGVLEVDFAGYKCRQTEVLGFNHQVAKRYVAHVAFADGHVDVLVEPKGTSDNDLKELAKELCNGDEVSQTLRDKMH